MLKKWKLAGAILVSMLLVNLIITQAQGNDPTSINCSVFSSGSANGANSGMTLVGTLGQWGVVNSTQGGSQLSSGFWLIVLEGCGGNEPIHQSQVFLPIFSKSPPLDLSYVLITNRTGGEMTYEIPAPGHPAPPEGRISCQVPIGAIDYFCDKLFTPGTYSWKATAKCGSLTGTKTYQVGGNFIPAFSCE
jgi:hypothetical protein